MTAPSCVWQAKATPDTPLVVFGHSLSLEADGHLFFDVRVIALSVFPPNSLWPKNAKRLELALKTFGNEPPLFDCHQHSLAQALCPPEAAPSPI